MALNELDGSPTESYSPKFSAVRKFECPWSERYTWRNVIMSPPGELYPYATEMLAYATQLSIDGFGRQGVAGPLASYEKAFLTVTYDTPEAPAGGDGVIVEEHMRPNVEFIMLDSRNFIWGSDGRYLRPTESPGVKIMGSIYSVTRRNLLAVKQEYITYAGRINSIAITTSMTTPALTFPAESLLYSSAEISSRIYSAGLRIHDVTLNFVWSESPSWNKFLRIKSGSAKDFDTIRYFPGDTAPVTVVPYGTPISFGTLLT